MITRIARRPMRQVSHLPVHVIISKVVDESSNASDELPPRPPSPGRSVRLLDHPGLFLLRDAWDCACEIEQDVWQLAVEIDALRSAGLSSTELRWLISRGLVEHRHELTRPGESRRRFQKSGRASLALPERDCFILTEAGCQFVSRMSPPSADDEHLVHPTLQKPNSRIPSWDPKLHELRLGRQTIKRYTHAAPAQELILTALQEENWPPAIDDPLPSQFSEDPKRRLHHTVRNLNRSQHPFRIRFFINGDGQSIRWHVVPHIRAKSTHRAPRRRLSLN